MPCDDKTPREEKTAMGIGVTAEHVPITNWAAILGLWEFPSLDQAVYVSPQPQWENLPSLGRPFGICISNVRFSDGDAKVTIRFPKTATDVAAAFLLGYRSLYDPYIMVGLGGWGFAYTIGEFDRVRGWHAVAFAGSQNNLRVDHPYKPTFPGFWVVGGQDRPVGPPCNGKSRCARAGGVENRGLTCSEARKPTAPPASRRTSPLVAVASDPRPSCWRGRRPQPGDQTENVVEHLSRHRNLGHLKRDVAAVADHLGGDLDQLFPQAGQRPWLRRLGHRQRSHEIAEIVGQGMELKANRVGSERTA